MIREIIEDAKRAPSSMNSQPWHVHVLAGEPLEQVRRRNMEEMAAGKPSKPDIFTHRPYRGAGAHRESQVGVAKQPFAAMGIARDDAAMRQDCVLRGFRQFDGFPAWTSGPRLGMKKTRRDWVGRAWVGAGMKSATIGFFLAGTC